MNQVPAPTWEVVEVPHPALVTKDGAGSAVAHSEWVRLFLGRSLAPAKLVDQPGRAPKVEYLVQGVPYKQIAVEELRAAAVKAAERDVAQLKQALTSHRRDIEAARDGSASMHPELFLNSFRVLASVTVSRDPDDWRITDEGLSIVRWGLAGERSEPLLAWTDQELDAQLRRVTEGFSKVARPESASEKAADADERRLKSQINTIVEARVKKERAELERRAELEINARLKRLSQSSSGLEPIDPGAPMYAPPMPRRQGVAPWIAIAAGVAALLFLGVSIWFGWAWQKADRIATKNWKDLSTARDALNEAERSRASTDGRLAVVEAHLNGTREALGVKSGIDPTDTARKLMAAHSAELDALNRAGKALTDRPIEFGSQEFHMPNEEIQGRLASAIAALIAARNDARDRLIDTELLVGPRPSLSEAVDRALAQIRALEGTATKSEGAASTQAAQIEQWVDRAKRLVKFLSNVGLPAGTTASPVDFADPLPPQFQDDYKRFLGRWEALALAEHKGGAVALWCRGSLLAPELGSPLDGKNALQGIRDAAAVDALLAASQRGGDGDFLKTLNEQRVDRGLDPFSVMAGVPCDNARLAELVKALRSCIDCPKDPGDKPCIWRIRQARYEERPNTRVFFTLEDGKAASDGSLSRLVGPQKADEGEAKVSPYKPGKGVTTYLDTSPPFGESVGKVLESALPASPLDCRDTLAIAVMRAILDRVSNAPIANADPSRVARIPAGLAIRMLEALTAVMVEDRKELVSQDLQGVLRGWRDNPRGTTPKPGLLKSLCKKRWLDENGLESDISTKQMKPAVERLASMLRDWESSRSTPVPAPLPRDLALLGGVLFSVASEQPSANSPTGFADQLSPTGPYSNAKGCELYVVLSPNMSSYKSVKIGSCDKDGTPSLVIPQEAMAATGLVVLRGPPQQGPPPSKKK